MTTLLDKIKKGVNKVPLRALIYGPHGTGKSTFASSFPSPIILDTEGNVDHLPQEKYRATTWAEIVNFLDNLLSLEHEYKTLVIDSADLLEEFVQIAARQETCTESLSSNYGQGWAKMIDLLQALRGQLERLNREKRMHVILISHVKTKQVISLDTPTHEMIMPRLHDKIAHIFLDWCNLVGYAHKRLSVAENKDAGFGKKITVMKGNERDLQVGPSAVHVAKETFQLKKTDSNTVPLSSSFILEQIKNFYKR